MKQDRQLIYLELMHFLLAAPNEGNGEGGGSVFVLGS